MPDYAEACHNMRLYLKQAVLPDMHLTSMCPPVYEDLRTPAHLFLLSPEPDSRRKLRVVLHLLPHVVNKRLLACESPRFFLHTEIPDEALAGAQDYCGERCAMLYIPAESFAIALVPPADMCDMQTMAPWVSLPLMTAERVMHLVWPAQTRAFCIKGETRGQGLGRDDDDLYKAYYWKRCRGVDQDDLQQPRCKLVVASLVPWALSPLDLADFMRVPEFPAFTIEHGNVARPPGYTRAHKIWAKLWDNCTRKSCPYFVVSVYHGWVFGVFVRGWTTALVSEVVETTAREPNVMEWLVYWIAAAMDLPGSWSLPRLKRFSNPDINDASKVAARLSPLSTEQDEHVDWLEKNHKVEKPEQAGKTYQVSGHANTWYTDFDDEQ